MKFDARAFFHARGTYLGREMSMLEMKAHQMAWAVRRVERVWRRAWDEGQRPAPDGPADGAPVGGAGKERDAN